MSGEESTSRSGTSQSGGASIPYGQVKEIKFQLKEIQEAD